jgi:hypothetical protein
MLRAITDGRLQGTEIGLALVGGEDQLTVDHRGLAANACHRLGQKRQTLGPVATALGVEPDRATVLDDLEAVAVKLWLM